MKEWYAVYTKAQREEAAARHLLNQGFSVHFPRYCKTRRHAGRSDVVPAPLFPRYLFVGVDMQTQRWRSINGTVGVVGLVSCGDRPLRVPDDVLDEIRAREDAAGFVCMQPTPFTRGQYVRVSDGPMVDTLALFEEAIDENRAILLVSLMGRSVRTRMPLAMIEAA